MLDANINENEFFNKSDIAHFVKKTYFDDKSKEY